MPSGRPSLHLTQNRLRAVLRFLCLAQMASLRYDFVTMTNKLLWFIGAVLVGGAVVYFAVSNPPTFADPYAGLVTEITPSISDDKKAEYEAHIAEVTAEIATKSAAGEYVLDVYFVRGGDYQHLGKLKLAFEDYQTVLEGDPENETAWGNSGDLRIAMGDVEGAEMYYKKAVEVYPAETTYNKLYRYYLQYRAEDRDAAVETLLKEAMEKVGPSVPLYVKLGRWYVEHNDRENAILAYRQAAVLDPDNQSIKDELQKALAL